jgi:hypothetical protein
MWLAKTTSAGAKQWGRIYDGAGVDRLVAPSACRGLVFDRGIHSLLSDFLYCGLVAVRMRVIWLLEFERDFDFGLIFGFRTR